MKVEHKVEKKRVMQTFEYFFMGRAKQFFSAAVASHTSSEGNATQQGDSGLTALEPSDRYTTCATATA